MFYLISIHLNEPSWVQFWVTENRFLLGRTYNSLESLYSVFVKQLIEDWICLIRSIKKHFYLANYHESGYIF